MRSRGPIITLLVVVVLAAVLLVVNLSKGSPNDTAAPAAAPGAAAPAAPAPGAAAPAPAAGAPAAPRAPGAAADPFPAQAKYTGHTDGIKAAIAVTVRDDKVSAYLCDGKAVEGWYQGTASGGSVQAKGRGTNALTGTLSGSTLSGTVSAGGKSWSYTAAPSAAPAGLYRSKTPNATVGWIKDSNGQVTGLANEGGTVRPAPPLDPGTATAIEGGDQVVGQ
ncbi:MAG TPA: hypothetical protein VNP03_00790 [Pseudonocardia sp.]|nr:hypothetical protein [Pseudonocardia sp.]